MLKFRKLQAAASEALACSLLAFLRRADFSKRVVEQKIVDDLQSASDEKGSVNQRRLRKEKSHKQRAKCRACGACDSRESASRRSFFSWNDRHCIGLPCGDIHLADAEAEKQHQYGQRERGH